MSTAEAIKEIRDLFAEFGIECSEAEAERLIEIGMRAKVATALRKASTPA